MSSAETTPNAFAQRAYSISILDIAYGLALFSLTPMLWLQCNSLWSRPHLQFFPMAWAAFGYFFIQRFGGLTTTLSRSRQFVSGAVLVASLIAAGEAVLISSPWLSYVAAVLVVTSWLLLRAGNISWQSAIAITSLLWITVPLPAGYDKKMIQYLQAQSSFAASSVLDVVGIAHLREGNILQLLDKRLFVDEACSGVDSLYALMAISLTLVLFMKQRFVVALCALSMVIVWASCGNVLRLVLIVFGLQWVGIDLSTGTPHTILGLCVFCIAFACDFAFIRFLGALAAPVVTSRRRAEVAVAVNRKERMRVNRSSALSKLVIAMSMSCVVGFLALGAYSTKVLRGGTVFRFPEFTDSSLQRLKDSLVMPEQLANWKLAKSELIERSVDSVMGQFSHVWYYDAAGQLGTISVDFPFRGFHLLDICYEGAGWKQGEKPKSEDIVLGPSSIQNPEPAQVHFLDLSKDTGEYAYVAYVQFQLDGTPVHSKAVGRGFERFEQTFLEPVTYQLQSIMMSKTPISEDQKKEIQQNLLSVATLLRPRFVGLEAKY
jgi:exosortase